MRVLIPSALLSYTSENWVEAAGGTVAEVVNDPQLVAREMIIDHWDERANRNVKGPGIIPKLSESPGAVRNAGPAAMGQHNDEVYRDLLGYTPERLDQLTEDGIL